ncbi:outer membrane beta-barrel protein [Flavobacterium paronense]|uniref:Outer membrane beta-barrel protein n=1 Tax=Flavobacterium paronense TaxID=1392775 RepID=A0ABV5GDB6_9FLAO|nr:outer membrane beta-barrel protein [Flavobacterium paronense]MDN3677918.1 outer membrane beta-barrel protein [Flavobacterium paronense]
MKKIIFTIAVVLTATIANAQLREKGTTELIPQIGYSSSNYVGNQVGSGNSPITDLSFGVAGDYFFNNRWSLRSGLLFQTMGTEISVGTEKLKYITFPVNANWHFGSTRKWNLNFGPSIGFLTSATDNGTDVKELFNTTQLGLNYGIGYKIEVSKQISILIDYQGMSGLSKIAKDSSINVKNAYGSFDLGCVFKL